MRFITKDQGSPSSFPASSREPWLQWLMDYHLRYLPRPKTRIISCDTNALSLKSTAKSSTDFPSLVLHDDTVHLSPANMASDVLDIYQASFMTDQNEVFHFLRLLYLTLLADYLKAFLHWPNVTFLI